jgi:hypothetical protein
MCWSAHGNAHPKARAHIRSAALAFGKPIDGVWASDHFGIVVDLDVGMNSSSGRCNIRECK